MIQWTSSSDINPFEEDDIDKLLKYQKDPISSIMLQKMFKFHLYEELDPDTSYIMSVDVAGGLSRDRSAIVLSEYETMRTVGVFKSNTIDTPQLTAAIVELWKYIPDRTAIVIENNSYGLVVIQHLLLTECKKAIFYTETKIANSTKVKKEYGICTNKKTRPLILECMKLLILSEPETWISSLLIEEIRTLEEKKNGKIEHADGEYDDAIMAKSFASYAKTYYAKTLRKIMRVDSKSIKKAMMGLSQHNNINKETSSSGIIEGSVVDAFKHSGKPKKPSKFRNVLSYNRNEADKPKRNLIDLN